MKIAIIYDWIDKWGGVERLLLSLHELYPDAEFYTSYYNPQTAEWAKDLKIKTSFINKLPGFIKKNRVLSILLYPLAFESFDFSGYDLVISVTSSFAKGVITKPETKHICYLLTPSRYLWGQTDMYLKNPIISSGGKLTGSGLRKWDFVAAQRPDKIVAISKLVVERAKKYYKTATSEVVYPPFDLDYWEKVKTSVTEEDRFSFKKPYYLVVSRLESYKRIELVLEAFRQLQDETLVIVGDGTQKESLQKLAGENVIFLENISDSRLADIYTHAKALIMPQEEDFGYVSLESQFFSTPVLSYSKSGAAETIIDGKTGLLFNEQTVESILSVLQKYQEVGSKIKETLKLHKTDHLKQFSKKQFLEKFKNIV